MATKKELLSELSFEYIRSFAVNTRIIQTRGLYHTKKDHVRALVRSLSKPETEFLHQKFQSGTPVDKTCERFLRMYRPDDSVIRKEMARVLNSEGAKNNAASLLFEVPLQSNRADMVVVNDSITVYEIKSPRDSYRRLPDQLDTYTAVADYVNVVHPRTDNSTEVIDENVGVIEFTYPDFDFHQTRESEFLMPEIGDRLSILWDSELQNIMVEEFGSDGTDMSRQEIEAKIQNECPGSRLNAHIRHQLKNRVRADDIDHGQATLSV